MVGDIEVKRSLSGQALVRLFTLSNLFYGLDQTLHLHPYHKTSRYLQQGLVRYDLYAVRQIRFLEGGKEARREAGRKRWEPGNTRNSNCMDIAVLLQGVELYFACDQRIYIFLPIPYLAIGINPNSHERPLLKQLAIASLRSQRKRNTFKAPTPNVESGTNQRLIQRRMQLLLHSDCI